MQRRLCEMSEAKWSITEAKCLQISHNKYASQRDAISPLYGNLMLSHSAGMHNTDKSIAGISKRFHFASLHYIFSAYLPTHIKFLTEFHRISFGTTCIIISKIKGRIAIALKRTSLKKRIFKTLDIDNLLRANKRANTPIVSHHQRDGSFDGVFPMCRYIGVCVETCQRHVPTL